MIELIFIFILGLFMGSFFGVVVDRSQNKKSIIKGRSQCDFCKKELSFFDLIPVFSFIFLRGKCRYCKTKLSFFYPAIEVLTGVVFALSYIFLNSQFSPTEISIGTILNFQLIYYLFIFSTLIILFFQDLKYGILSDKLIALSVLVSLFYLFLFQRQEFVSHLLVATVSFAFFVLISLAFYVLTKKQGMGGGDIKISFLLGLILGFPNVIICFYLAFLTGAVASIILVLWRKKDYLKDSLPFGPFLIGATIISLFWGNYIYSLALNLLGI